MDLTYGQQRVLNSPLTKTLNEYNEKRELDAVRPNCETINTAIESTERQD